MASPVRLAKEAHEYAVSFLRENSAFWIGLRNTNRALVYVIEATRMLADAAGGRKTAIKLLEVALADVREVEDSSIPE